MTATAYSRLTETKGPYPLLGTYEVAASEFIGHGWIVCLDADGRAIAGADGEGFAAVGRSSVTADNRPTAPEGGGAGAIDCEVDFGVFGWNYTGATPNAGDTVFVVDNQTVSVDSDSGARGLAGTVVEVRDSSSVFVHMGPHVVAMLGVTQAYVPLPITQWADNGGPLKAWVDGSVNGLELVDSEVLAFRFGPVGEDTSVLSTTVPLPLDMDPSSDITVHALCARIGSADTTVKLTANAFFHVVGAAYDADSDAITVDSAVIDAATKVVEEATLTIAAADVPEVPCDLTLTLAPTAALDADDLIITSVWVEYTRKMRTS